MNRKNDRGEPGEQYDRGGMDIAHKDSTCQFHCGNLDHCDQEYCWDMLRGVNSIILKWDARLHISYINDFALSFFGYTCEELLGKSLVGTIVPETSSEGENLILMLEDLVRNPEQYITNENENLKRDGTKAWISWTNRAIRDNQGKVKEILSVGNDISKRKKIEDELHRSREELEDNVVARTRDLEDEIEKHRQAEKATISEKRFSDAVIDSIPGIFYVFDTSGHFVRCNKNMLTVTGLTSEELMTLRPVDVIAEEDRDLISMKIREAFEKGYATVTGRLFTRDGQKIPYLLNGFTTAIDGKEYVVGVGIDIAERVRAEDALRDSEARLNSILRVAPTGIGVVVNRVITEANSKLCEMIGYSREELLGKSSRILYPTQEEFDFVGLEKYRMIKEHGTGTVQTYWRRKDGRIIDILLSSTPLDPEKISAGVTFTALDVTERNRAERALLESEENLRLAIDTSKMGMWNWNLVTDELIWSDRCKEIYGLSLDSEMNYQLFLQTIHPDDRDRIAEEIKKALDQKTDYDTEMRVPWHDGTMHWASSKGRGFYDVNGRSIRMLGMALDITERKHAEESLKESERNLTHAQAISHVGNWYIYPDTLTGSGSDEFFRILGMPKQDAYSMDQFSTLVHPDDRDEYYSRFSQAIRTGQPFRMEYRIVRPDGTERFIHAEGEFSVSGTGPVKMFGTIQDITEQKLAEDALKDAKAKAELYLDLMSHDIINMNQAMMGYMELIKDLMKPGETELELIESTIDIINRSTRIIKNVKKLTLLQSGTIPYEIIDLCKILTEVKSKYSNIHDRDVTINLSSCGNNLSKAGEPIRDVFENLVDNAIRHSSGPVRVDISIDRTEIRGIVYNQVAVADTGPGITDDLKVKIFQHQKRAGKQTERRGFGLYLVRTVVDYYHGKVWVEDRVSGDCKKGSRFIVRLPAA